MKRNLSMSGQKDFLLALATMSVINGYSTDKPNVLIIMADQLNPLVLSCYGGPVNTPNIDLLAGQGAIFMNAICTFPVSSPSRASMITGQYVHKHGICQNCDKVDMPVFKRPDSEECITNSDITTEKILFKGGYSTHHYGKWHLNQEIPDYFPDMYPENSYTDEMQGYFDSVRFTPEETWMKWYNWALPVTQTDDFIRAITPVRNVFEEDTYGQFIIKMGLLRMGLEDSFEFRTASRTIERIESQSDDPFMITCSFNTPHDPNVSPLPYYDMFDPEKISYPVNYLNTEPYFEENWSRKIISKTGDDGVREFLRIYYGNTKLIDDQVGRIIEALKKKGVYDNTIIIFTADHGDMAGAHGMVWKSTSAFFNEVVRVPLIIRFPSAIKPAKFEVPVSLVDLMPTILDFTGFSVPESCQGHSLVNLLSGKEKEEDHYQYAFCERISANKGNVRKMNEDWKGAFMVMDKKGKYIEYPDGTRFFYNLVKDPYETVNEYNNQEYSAEISRYNKELKEWLTRTIQ